MTASFSDQRARIVSDDPKFQIVDLELKLESFEKGYQQVVGFTVTLSLKEEKSEKTIPTQIVFHRVSSHLLTALIQAIQLKLLVSLPGVEVSSGLSKS